MKVCDLQLKKEIFKEQIEKYCYSDCINFGDKILYEMCKNNPKHESKDIIIGKIWLIGRSYAAAIERRKPSENENPNDDFYDTVVANKIYEIHKGLDDRIAELNKFDDINEDNLRSVLETHGFLTRAYKDITNMNKRSLASKYLHFHVPKMFYIYDSQAIDATRKLVNKNELLLSKFSESFSVESIDYEYADFVTRLFWLQEYIFNEYQIKLTPRQTDTFLLEKRKAEFIKK